MTKLPVLTSSLLLEQIDVEHISPEFVLVVDTTLEELEIELEIELE